MSTDSNKEEQIDIALANLVFAGLSIAQMDKIPKWLLKNIEENKNTFKEFLHHQLQKARENWLREEIVRLEGMDEYIAVKDNDGHRYQIPSSKKEAWNTFCEIPEDDERSWDVPEWAERIDGVPVKSFKQTIIDRYSKELNQDTNNK